MPERVERHLIFGARYPALLRKKRSPSGVIDADLEPRGERADITVLHRETLALARSSSEPRAVGVAGADLTLVRRVTVGQTLRCSPNRVRTAARFGTAVRASGATKRCPRDIALRFEFLPGPARRAAVRPDADGARARAAFSPASRRTVRRRARPLPANLPLRTTSSVFRTDLEPAVRLRSPSLAARVDFHGGGEAETARFGSRTIRPVVAEVDDLCLLRELLRRNALPARRIGARLLSRVATRIAALNETARAPSAPSARRLARSLCFGRRIGHRRPRSDRGLDAPRSRRRRRS
jgi:hypothetical protein